jgi:hypothetical protein
LSSLFEHVFSVANTYDYTPPYGRDPDDVTSMSQVNKTDNGMVVQRKEYPATCV